MKNTVLKTTFAILALAGLSSSATVITVSNNAVAAGQYSNLQTALDAATVGDTVYVHGSTTSYGAVTIKKRLTLIGAGHHVTGTQYNYSTQTGSITIDTIPFTNPIAGIKIIGIDVYGNVDGASGDIVNNLTIERCYVTTIVLKGKNCIIKNNIFYNIDVNDNANTFIYNNFIGQIYDSSQPTVVIDHNVFGPYHGTAFATMSNSLVSNNIFYYSTCTTNCTNVTFNNNLTFHSNSQVLPPANNTGANNLNNTTPDFVGSPPSNVSQANVDNNDWHLKTVSAGHNASTDGTDVGVYGGSYVMPNLNGVTTLPQITLMNIGNAVVPQGGTLNVNFKAKKQD